MRNQGKLRIHARVQTQLLLHNLVRRKADGHHGNGADVVDGHSAVESVFDSILVVDQAKSLDKTFGIFARVLVQHGQLHASASHVQRVGKGLRNGT